MAAASRHRLCARRSREGGGDWDHSKGEAGPAVAAARVGGLATLRPCEEHKVPIRGDLLSVQLTTGLTGEAVSGESYYRTPGGTPVGAPYEERLSPPVARVLPGDIHVRPHHSNDRRRRNTRIAAQIHNRAKTDLAGRRDRNRATY